MTTGGGLPFSRNNALPRASTFIRPWEEKRNGEDVRASQQLKHSNFRSILDLRGCSQLPLTKIWKELSSDTTRKIRLRVTPLQQEKNLGDLAALVNTNRVEVLVLSRLRIVEMKKYSKCPKDPSSAEPIQNPPDKFSRTEQAVEAQFAQRRASIVLTTTDSASREQHIVHSSQQVPHPRRKEPVHSEKNARESKVVQQHLPSRSAQGKSNHVLFNPITGQSRVIEVRSWERRPTTSVKECFQQRF